MKRGLTLVAFLTLAIVLAAGCAMAGTGVSTPNQTIGPASSAEKANFTLLISDEVNAMKDFERLDVTVSSVGVHQGGDSGTWHTLDPNADPDGDGTPGINLKPLDGEKALAIWSGTLPPGDYTKVFIYVDEISWVLAGEDNPDVEVKLPSQKLQIIKPFTIEEGSEVAFVYDITVVKAGESGKYILRPQIAQSGADQKFDEVEVQGKGNVGKYELQLRLEGDVGLGEEVTLVVTGDGTPMVDAAVTVNGQTLATKTDTEGKVRITLPNTPGEVEIIATSGDKDGRLKLELESSEEEAEWFEGTITAITIGAENASPWTQ